MYMTEVQKIIIKHYGKSKKFKTRGWEQCGYEIYALIDKKQAKLRQTKRYNSKIYGDQCRMEQEVHDKIENEYKQYFIFYGLSEGGGYNWIKGNNSLKELILTNKRG